jgi:hypothetical protein
MTNTPDDLPPGAAPGATPDAAPDADADAADAIEHLPELDALRTIAAAPDLEARVRERHAQLLGKLRELTTDKRVEAPESRDRLKATLSELKHIVKWGVVDGWARVGGPVTDKLEQWLAGCAHQVAPRDQQP